MILATDEYDGKRQECRIIKRDLKAAKDLYKTTLAIAVKEAPIEDEDGNDLPLKMVL